MTDLRSVIEFWEQNPLWTGESAHEAGSVAFFENHRAVYLSDCLGGVFDLRLMPPPRRGGQEMRVLDLGCGIGFWVSEFAMRGVGYLHAADLTQRALELTQQRLDVLGLKADLSRQNAESMTFADGEFDHVNCQGVVHHTPDTAAAIAEIARVLKPGGTASISVYYRNSILRLWPYMRWAGCLLAWLGGGLKGRGREGIFLEKDVDNIVRLYDGTENPLGKSYTKREFESLLVSHFEVDETYLHFFPARALPFRIPTMVHGWLDQHLGFMIYASVTKPCAG
jgi:2-polyprenyl-3-methyl-5-hydroxy-6-metoxy-1,4-benzoquinol methylase